MKKFLFAILIAFVAVCAFLAPAESAKVISAVAIISLTVFVVANTSRRSRRLGLTAAVNTLPPNWGKVSNGKTLLSSAAVATRFLLGKFGADATHVAVIAAASDEPIGVMTDEASAAEEEMFVELLGLTNRTVPVVAKVATTLNCDLYSNGDGKVTIKPTSAGTYWRVGKGLTAATADGDVIEMLPCRPKKLIVVSALDSANGALAAATGSVAAQAAETEKLGDDVRKIAAALDADADVALATT